MRMTTAKDLPKVCFLCGRNGTTDPLDAHHIFGGANRKLSERYALVVPLCHDRCHENGKDAVHRNAATAQALHEFGQRLAMERMGWSIEEFRAVFGRIYLPEDPRRGTEESLIRPYGAPSPEGRQGEVPHPALRATFPQGKADAAAGRGTGDPSSTASGTPSPRGRQGEVPHQSPAATASPEGSQFSILDEEVRPVWL